MKKIQLLEDFPVSEDGFTTRTAAKGELVELSDGSAGDLIERKIAKLPAKKRATKQKKTPENK